MNKQIKRVLLAGILVLVIFPFIYFVSVYYTSYQILKNESRQQPGLSTRIYDINNRLISELFDENRSYVKIEDIPEPVKKAFIAAEDSSFYRHTGIDITGIIRAVVADLVTGSLRQGGSTITQQLAKQLYTRREKTVKRKIVELLIAMKFERKYSKDEILEMYLNQIYFGHGVYGVKSASRFYFDRELEEIGIPEAAVLASIPAAPGRYSPLVNPELAFEKSKKVIYNLIYAGHTERSEVTDGFNEFWTRFLDELKVRYPGVGVRNIKNDRAPFFTEYIRRVLVKKYGEEMVYRGGLKVYTTLDLRHQEIAQSLLSEEVKRQNSLSDRYGRYSGRGVDRILARKRIKNRKDHKTGAHLYKKLREDLLEEILLGGLLLDTAPLESVVSGHLETVSDYRKTSRVQGAFISLEPDTGGITAMVGGADPGSGNQLNRAVQSVRQPGSAFKTFIYGAALESKKMTLATPFDDLPVFFRGRKRDKDWAPSNYGSSFQGRVLARRAFAHSLNVVSVLIYQMIGGARISGFASRIIGIPKKRITVDPSLALGTTELSPLEMAAGFGVVANRGISVTPYSIRYILDQNGKKIFNGEDIVKKKRRRVLSKETSFLMTSMMKSVADYGTASGAIRKVAGFWGQAAGKTGTNTDFRDAWFVGFTPDLVASVWIGCDSQKFTLVPGQSGAVAAAPVWGKFMKKVYRFRKKKWFGKAPGGIVRASICKKSGKLPVRGCPVKKEYFLKGTVPSEKCNSEHSGFMDIFGPAKKKRESIKKREGLLEKDKEVHYF
jgi:penicillin-binding protein 1A